MPFVLNAKASIDCGHGGTVQVTAGQHTLTAGGAAVLVEGDLDGRPIKNCSVESVAPMLKCAVVASVSGGTATSLSAGGRAALLDTVTGLTNGNPPGVLAVRSPGQTTLRAR